MTASMKQYPALTLLLTLGLMIAIFIVNDYGESWDEMKLYDYADNSLAAYVTWFQEGTIPFTGDRFENYGPFFVMVTRILSKTISGLVPSIHEVDVQHLMYFVSFLAGMWAFYQLGARWMSRNAALGATLLFMTQPIFWGHAFINPKDIPLLSFLLLSVHLGIRMHHLAFGREADSVFPSASAAWSQLPGRTRRLLAAAVAVWLVLLILLFGGIPFINRWIEQAVRLAAAGEPSLITVIVPRVVRVDPEIYVERFFTLFLQMRAVFFLLVTAIMVWLFRRYFASIWVLLRVILPAAIILGLTVSIRIFGVWAGVLVAGYILWKSGLKTWPVLTAYVLIAIMTMYLTWPYLWPDPVGHFWETVHIMSQHPWPGSVLFNGATYPANDLPPSYLPVLLGIQLTEPVWILFFVGLAVGVVETMRKRREKLELLAFTLVWFILPLSTFVILRPTLYDNFRQTFFILPPVFLMTGLAFDLVRRPMLQTAFIALVLLPGLVASIRLHPYQYVYYNQFVDGLDGAVDRFELEYWGTSYREAAQAANGIAPPNANVWVDGPAHLFSRFARPDFHLYSPQEAERADRYDIVVTLARYNWEKTSFPEAEIVYTVGREGAVFAVIRTP
ncbi:MAG TPA: hypothetical protein VK900_19285 [Anaerolineales bacterium]|nr:hypothetical protein [Anaerolineales bacterium]